MEDLHKNIIYQNIIDLCRSHVPKVSFSKMCVDLGLSKSIGTRLKDNPDGNINGETAQKIADYFGVTIDKVLGKEQQKKPAPVKGGRDYTDAELLEAFRRADETTRAAIQILLKVE